MNKILYNDGGCNKISYNNLINYKFAELISDYIYKLNIKPNYITIFNMLLRIFFFYFLVKRKITKIISIIIILFSEFLDCLDGYIARKYNQKSKLGAMLDRYSDIIYITSFFLIILFFTKKTFFTNLILIIYPLLFVILVIKNDFNVEENIKITKKNNYLCQNYYFQLYKILLDLLAIIFCILILSLKNFKFI